MSWQGQQEVTLRQISEIRAQRDELSRQLLQLQWDFNASLPVGRLPNELLIDIFVLSREFMKMMPVFFVVR